MQTSVDHELWPIGNNKELLYSIIDYIQQILQEHGTRLISEELIKLSKVKADMRSLLETLNGDFTMPDLDFTLPGIYKFYNSTLNEPVHNIDHNDKNEMSSIDTKITMVEDENSIAISTDYEPKSLSPSNITISTNTISSEAPILNDNYNISLIENEIDNLNEEKYEMFDTFLCKLKDKKSEKINETSPEYLVFLETARKEYNEQYSTEEDCKYIIKSLNNVPSLRAILYKIRYMNEKSLSHISMNKIRFYNNYKSYVKQCIAIKGYYNRFLSVYKNGKSELKKKCEIGYNELFYTMPIKNNEIYIKTYSSNLYLGSDENGLLFIGNVRKHYQIWTIECNNENNNNYNTYSFKNYFGFFLTINSNGELIANNKYKKDLEKFQIYVIDEKQYIKKTIRKSFIQKQRRKISIDDMDIRPINYKILAPKKTYAYRTRTKGHHRAHTQRIKPAPPPPPPQISRNNSDNYLLPHKSNQILTSQKSILNNRKKLKRYRKSDPDKKYVYNQQLHKRSKSLMNITNNNNNENDKLINELKIELNKKRKSVAIDYLKHKNKENNNNNNQNALMDELKNKLKKNDNNVDDDDCKELCVDNDDTQNKPALPNKSAKIVVKEIRSKYQRPLPALPKSDKINEMD